MVKTAIKSNYFNEFTNVKALYEKKEGNSEEQDKLKSLANHSGWRVLRAYIGRIMEELDEMTRTQMSQGLPFEEIGRSTVVREITKDALKRIINKVQDAAESESSS